MPVLRNKSSYPEAPFIYGGDFLSDDATVTPDPVPEVDDSFTPVVVPQLAETPVMVIGHSQTVPTAAYHGAGLHWSELLPGVSGSGTVTNVGVGGTTMEWWAGVIDSDPEGAYAPWAWPRPVTPTLLLVMNVFNSAYDITRGLAESVESLKNTARVIAVTALADTHTAYTIGQNGMSYAGGWSVAGGLPQGYAAGGVAYTATQNSDITWTVPSNQEYVWASMLSVAPAHSDYVNTPTVRITNNGEVVFDGPVPKSDYNAAGSPDAYTKCLLPVGPVTAGQTVTLRKTDAGPGLIFFDGFLYLGTKHHVAFVLEAEDVQANPGSPYPLYSVESIRAHNAALVELKAELDLIAPGGVSLLDLSTTDNFDQATMCWTGDNLHLNRKGNAWELSHLTQQLLEQIPWTTRLHTL